MTTNEEPNQLTGIYDRWLRQIEIRNNTAYGSARYNRAEAKADAMEREASMLIFGDESHSMTECFPDA